MNEPNEYIAAESTARPADNQHIIELIVDEVLKLERTMLHMEKPRGIVEDIGKVICNIVRD